MVSGPGPRVVLQAPVGDSLAWPLLESPAQILRASTLGEVAPVLRDAEAAALTGKLAAGFVSYEAAPAFDPALRVRTTDALPLAWFAIFDEARTLR